MKHNPNIQPSLPQPKHAPKCQHLPVGRQVRYSIFLILLAALITCQKPEPPTGGNKIELGQTTADSIGYFTAKVSTTMESTGGNQITQHGHCWSTKSNPTTDDAKTTLGKLDKPETFTSELTGLQDNTNYYIRSYTTYPYGTVYGAEKNIKTLETRKPQVSTAAVTNITRTSATCGGTNDNGGLTITARGVCWNTTGNPTLQNSTGHTTNGSGTGSFTSNITGLTENTTYYVVGYATNEKGTGYGEVKSFITLELTLPIVETAEITNITANSATGGGNVTGDGNGTVSARGVCWNTTGNPTLENNDGYTTDGSGTGSYISYITGLNENTTYYVAAYATNEEETNYGDIKTFVTLDDPCDGVTTITYHGQTYHTVPIGDQCWMKENLNYETGNSWCYDNDQANCDVYGRLYDWTTIMNGASSSNEVPSGVQGICPDGWHIPSDAEWDILVDYLGGSDVAGGKMKETGTTHWSSPNTGATNESGFTALPGGYRDYNGGFYSLHNYGYWWSATEYSSTSAWNRILTYGYDGVYRGSTNKEDGFSVRCVRD